MNTDIRKLWAQTKIHVWPERYWLISFTPEQLPEAAVIVSVSAPHFAALIVEQEEVSLTVCERLWQLMGQQLPVQGKLGPYRVISFMLNLDLGIIGYLLPAAERLAENGVSILPQCAFLKDHLLIKEDDVSRAITALEGLIAECRQ